MVSTLVTHAAPRASAVKAKAGRHDLSTCLSAAAHAAPVNTPGSGGGGGAAADDDDDDGGGGGGGDDLTTTTTTTTMTMMMILMTIIVTARSVFPGTNC